MIHKQTKLKYIPKNQKTSYSSICEIFDLNFKKILRLVPLLPAIKNDFIAFKDSCNDLHLICHDKSPYTGTYTLTHRIKSQEKIISNPGICFKIYFDAKLLEVVSVCKETRINNSHPFLTDCSDLSYQLELNIFMLRWLDYCLEKYDGAQWIQNS